MKTFKKTILIDLDGVLNEYTGDFDKDFIPPIKAGAKDFLKKLSNDFDLKLFTTRNKILATKWLIENNIDVFFEDITNTKDLAWLYIDDRCINFDGSFENLIDSIKSFKTQPGPTDGSWSASPTKTSFVVLYIPFKT